MGKLGYGLVGATLDRQQRPSPTHGRGRVSNSMGGARGRGRIGGGASRWRTIAGKWGDCEWAGFEVSLEKDVQIRVKKAGEQTSAFISFLHGLVHF